METVINRDELVDWLTYWIQEQTKSENIAEAKELEFVRDTLLDDNWALLKEVN